MKYLGKVVLLFGGTSNIGSSIARDMARFGAAVVVHYNNNEEKATNLVDECNGIYKQLKIKQEAHMVRADAKNKIEIRKAIEETIKKYKKLDFLINIFTYPFDPVVWNEMDLKKTENGYLEAFQIDVLGTKHAMDFAAQYLKKSKGSIINFSSSPVLSGYKEGTAYSVAKSGVKQLTMDYALKLGPYGIRVNSVAPGWVPRGTESKEELSIALNATPLKQLGKPEYISQVVCDVLDWQHVTGHIITIDGGEVIR